MISVIIFDFGNLIYKFDNNIFLKKINKFTNKTVFELNELIYVSSDLTRKYETGLITSDNFFNEIVKLCNLSISKKEFIKAYTNIFSPVHTTIELIKKLKKQYKIALISNTSEWDFFNIIRPCEIYNLFDAVSLSFKLKAMKPEKKIFLDILNKLNYDPKKCVYIDDIVKYVNVAKRIGMHGIHYTTYRDLIISLNRLGISV